MTAELPTPQIPQAVHAAMAEWGRHHAYVQRIDAEAERLDAQITDLQRALTELGQRHADLGRQRKAAADEAEIARGMVAYGCQSAGIEMPPVPPALPAAPVPPASAAPVEQGEVPVNNASYPPASPGADALHALGQGVAGHAVTETVTDPRSIEARPADRTGGDQPAEPGFQPESAAESESRRRRGGRRG